MNPDTILHQLIDQIEQHQFRHLYRNRATGHEARGWSGGLQMFSENKSTPNASGHFRWLSQILKQSSEANTETCKVKCANEILAWGGMPTRIDNNARGYRILNDVIRSAREGQRLNGAPMNSSYTKIAAIFGYGQNNTIWDSRVSTSLCLRLACLISDLNIPPKDANLLFPNLGYIPGLSHRVKRRLGEIQRYWPNVYQSWEGHFAGAKVLTRISELLCQRPEIKCPTFTDDIDAGKWTRWKVNMVFFSDDIVQCQSTSGEDEEVTEISVSNPTPPQSKAAEVTHPRDVAKEAENPEKLCDHRIINHISDIHFEPNCIATNNLNSAAAFGLPKGNHGLGSHRLLLELFRLNSGNLKIGARMRILDPAFDMVLEAALAAECPQKQGSVEITDQTCSIFVHQLGKIAEGREIDAIRNFTCNPPEWYREFLTSLPEAMQHPN
jgi:hypothetical protein